MKDYVSGVDTWCLWLYALDYSKFHLLIILYLRILSRMLLIKHICLKFNSVVTINVESLDYILCFLNTNTQWSKLLLKKKRKRENHLQRNGEAQAGFQFNQLLRGESAISVVAVDLLEKSLHDCRHLRVTFHLGCNNLVFCTILQRNLCGATMSLSNKKVFLMSLSSFFILLLSPALVLISPSLSSILFLDWRLPITLFGFHVEKCSQVRMLILSAGVVVINLITSLHLQKKLTA